MAELGYALWGQSSELVPRKYRDLMVPNLKTHSFLDSFYGLASQNVGLMGITGGSFSSPYKVPVGQGYAEGQGHPSQRPSIALAFRPRR